MPNLYVSGQRIVGSLHGHPQRLGMLRGGYVLCFSLPGVAGALPLGRLPRLRLTGLAYLTTILAVLATVSVTVLIKTETK